jgi:hypothetical protein
MYSTLRTNALPCLPVELPCKHGVQSAAVLVSLGAIVLAGPQGLVPAAFGCRCCALEASSTSLHGAQVCRHIFSYVQAGARAECMVHHSFVPVQWLQQLLFTVGSPLHHRSAAGVQMCRRHRRAAENSMLTVVATKQQALCILNPGDTQNMSHNSNLHTCLRLHLTQAALQ